MSENVNRYNGEILPFKTVSNVKPDVGINKDPGEDMCRLEDFESIGDMVKRFVRAGMVEQPIYVDADPGDLDVDMPSDFFDDNPGELLDTQIDLEDYLNAHQAEADGDHSKRDANNSENSAETPNNGEAQGGSSVADDDGAQLTSK